MIWSFEFNLTVFLLISAVSFYLAVKTKSLLSLPFVFGVLFIAGYGTGWLPEDFVPRTKLIEVGFIAFNVLIIHGGTSFSLKEIKKSSKAFMLILFSLLICGIFFMTIGRKILGNHMALLAYPSFFGGGATNAIASISIQRINPSLSFFPWLIFMFQSFFGIPLFVFLLKKIRKENTIKGSNVPERPIEQKNPVKGTAYYLAFIMSLSFLNKLFYDQFLSGTGLSINFTALILGVIIGELKLIDRAPLQNADCYGLLMLGLMSLMARTLAYVPLAVILKLIPIVLAGFALATLVLAGAGYALSRLLKMNKQKSLLLAISPLVAFPANEMIIKGIFKTDPEKAETLIRETRFGSLYVVNIFSVLIISVLTAFL